MGRPDAEEGKGIHVGDVGGSVAVEVSGDIVGGDKIVHIVDPSVVRATPRPLLQRSPYRGFEPFGDRDRELFFGREALIESLLRTVEASPLVLVVGASGSGKSSLVQAGLLPRYAERHGGRTLTMVPDQNPFKALESSLIQNGAPQKLARGVLTATPDAVLSALSSHLQAESGVLLVDQLEELFTHSDIGLRRPFTDVLLAIGRELRTSVRVVLALRADFADRLGPYTELARAVEKSIQFVTEMLPNELRQAIEAPATRHGVRFEPGLVDTIVADVRGQPGALPLLQYTLDQLWRREQDLPHFAADRTLLTETYRMLGGVRAALEKRADQLYADLGADGPAPSRRDLMRHIFLRLVDVGDGASDAGARPVRRRVPMLTFQRPREREVLDLLIEQKLLVSSAAPLTGPASLTTGNAANATVEVAHEAIFGCWDRLSTWIADARQTIVLKHRLSEDSRRWDELRNKGRLADAEDELWAGVRLDQALEMQHKGDYDALVGGLSLEEGAFLGASALAREARRNAERRRRRSTSQVLGSFLVAALLGLFYSLRMRAEADHAKLEALRSALQAREQAELARQAKQSSLARQYYRESELAFGPSGDALRQSARLAVASLQQTWTLDAHQLLLRWSRLLPPRPRVSWRAHQADISAFAVDTTHHVLATATAGEVALWSLNAGTEGVSLARLRDETTTRPAPFNHLVYSRDGERLAADCGARVCVWDTAASRLRTVDLGATEITALALSPDGRRLAVGRRHDATILVDLAKDWRVAELAERDCFRLAFTPDGKALVTASERGVRLLRLPPSTRHRKTVRRYGAVFAIDPTGEQMAINDPLGVFLWNIEKDSPAASGERIERPGDPLASRLFFSPGGDHLITTPATQIWDLRRGSEEEMRFVDAGSLVSFAGATSLVGVSGNSAFIMPFERARGERTRLVHEAPVRGVDFSEDSTALATADDHELSIFEPSDGKWKRVASAPLSGSDGVRISPDGRLAASWLGRRLSLVERRNSQAPFDWAAAPSAATTLQLEGVTDPSAAITDAAFSPDGARLALTSGAEIELIETLAPHARRSLERQPSHIGRVGFSPDGRWLAVATLERCDAGLPGAPGMTAVFDASTGARAGWRSNEAEGPNDGKACSVDIRFEAGASAGKHGDLDLLDAAPRWLQDTTRKTAGRWRVERRAGALLVTDTESGRALDLVQHDGSVTAFDFSADGGWLATASNDRTVRLWSLRPSDLIEDVCSRLPPDPSPHGESPVCGTASASSNAASPSLAPSGDPH